LSARHAPDDVRALALTIIKKQMPLTITFNQRHFQFNCLGIVQHVGVYALAVDPEKHKHFVPPFTSEADTLALDVINDTYQATRSLLQKFHTIQQAAAVLALACRSSPAFVMKGSLRPFFSPYFTQAAPFTPYPANSALPLVVSEWFSYRFAYPDWLGNVLTSESPNWARNTEAYWQRHFRAVEILSFFNKPVPDSPDHANLFQTITQGSTWT
jgi:hypothetical protein